MNSVSLEVQTSQTEPQQFGAPEPDSSKAAEKRSAASTVGSRLPSLNGWRAVSIALVLVSHFPHAAGFPVAKLYAIWWWASHGDLGVRFFFVISGFLITRLIILENDRVGHVSLKNFYIRRALRILPVYFVFILTLFWLSLFTPFRQTASIWWHNLTFTTNFVDFGSLARWWTSSHLWSLAVEEQFYLGWPAVFVFAGIAANSRRASLLLGIPILLAPAWREMSHTGWYPPILSRLFTTFSFFNYCDSLAVGCAAAILFSRRRELVRDHLEHWLKETSIVAALLIALPAILSKLQGARFIVYPLGPTAQACGFAALLLQSIFFPNLGIYRVLNWRWVSFFGVLSYSIYIWQEIFCSSPESFGLPPVWWMSFPGWVVPVFGVAFLSYYCLERPLLKLRAKLREPELKAGICQTINN
jgi:peptidoglycan/LPS O-acetylase OafA/YrhL